ncbi:MAG: inositol monophosphatase [Brevinematales bacterium]|nr:inositol monophosphatase [Brevinematales bacterium]
MRDLSQALKVALKAAWVGGKVIKEGFSLPKEVQFKRFADPVTEYDKRAEELIVETLTRWFPEASILTEEVLSRERGNEWRWIIDPLDGTVNFTHQIPFVCVSIGLEVKGEIVVGVIYNPILNETFWAVKGQGAFLNGKPIRVSQIADVGKALVVTGFPYEREGRIEEVMKPLPTLVRECEGFRRLGSAGMDLAYVACGRFEAFYEENLKPWDTAAGMLLVEEAGGKVTTYRGERFTPFEKHIVATNGLVHERMLHILSDVHPVT